MIYGYLAYALLLFIMIMIGNLFSFCLILPLELVILLIHSKNSIAISFFFLFWLIHKIIHFNSTNLLLILFSPFFIFYIYFLIS